MRIRNILTFLSATFVVAFLITGDAFAQRGGGGRVGGGGRPTVNRSPSMSRPSVSRPSTPSRPSVSRPTAGTRPSIPSRPSVGTRPATPSRPSAGTRPATPGAGTRPSIDRDKLQNQIGARPGQRPSMPGWFKPGESQLPATRPGGNRPTPPATQLPAKPGADRPTQLPSKPGTGKPPGRPPGTGKPPVATLPVEGRPPGVRPPGTRPPGVRPPTRPPVVRPPVAGRPPRPWRPGHPNHPSYRPGHWWKWATTGAITGWVVHRWTTPIYYRYGSGGTVYYENSVVYVNGQEYGSAEKYYDDTSTVAASVPEMTDEKAAEMEWMPLGVFALTAEGVNASSMYLQLALSKEGVIAGTFYNESTGATHPVEGMVDEKTQRAVWKAADGTNANLVMETGVYNLTQDTAELLVHFGPEQTQEVLLVRLKETERPEANASDGS